MKTTWVLLSVALVAVLIAGCGGGAVTKGNYDKIQTGMTEEQVVAILGQGEEQASGGVQLPGGSVKVLLWKAGDKSITVTFKDGKVISKAQMSL